VPSIWIVEDDPSIADLIALYLRKEEHRTEIIPDGALALRAFEAADTKPDLIVLDLMLPGLDGRGVARRIRQEHETPILMLTALDDDRDKIEGLDLGADDYVTKPFNPNELMARVRAILRRSSHPVVPQPEDDALTLANVRIEPDARRVSVAGLELALRTKEFDLLLEFAWHRDAVLTRDRLLERVWGGEFDGDTRTVDVTISRLRERLAAAHAEIAIETIRAVGYRMTAGPRAR
jgi:two-component system alkaline phosphatase synthesis response regulator PhoP/two-component system response regulator MtrA